MNDNELKYRIAISQMEGMGPVTLRKLLDLTGSAVGLTNPGPQTYMKATEPQRKWLRKINELPAEHIQWAEKMVGELKKTEFSTLTIEDPFFPSRLRHCHDAPPWIFVKGALKKTKYVLAIVGSRRATPYGLKFTRDLVQHLKSYDVTIVSGLALGIDGEAHRSAIHHGLPTWAVLAHGFDRLYPFANRKVARDMLENGAWITEFLPHSRPEQSHFPRRNRIIAGLCDVCVVVEAARKGGALITAELANGYGRDVMALPGRISDPVSVGCNALIRTHQAHLIEHPNNLTQLLGWKPKDHDYQLTMEVDLTDQQNKIIDSLDYRKATSIDTLSNHCSIPVDKLLIELLTLEMKGLIANTGAHHYIRAG